MYRFRTVLVVLPLFLVLPARSADNTPGQPDAKPLAKMLQRFNQVVPKDVAEKLNLSDDQKKELDKLQKDLDEKNQKFLIKALGKAVDLQDAIEKARTDKNTDDLTMGALEMGVLTLELIKSQRATEGKFRDLLTDEQKKMYDQSKKPSRPSRDKGK
jgi:hypothetical protein